MVEKRSKTSRREELETTLPAPSDPAQSSAPSVHAQSLLPELILPETNDVVAQNTTELTGVDDQPESPDARDEEFLRLLSQAPG
jgi:hypothetical protein